ncbi:alpha-amylase family glycosyl hydrolase [Salinicoccus sesuvii]|uniref:Alpha-amylase family glycosyl hydrolase n=1 Tax=Salinicoccus sesuvii TaxID=868281 RepID=A0ABV7NAJ9_9STAP
MRKLVIYVAVLLAGVGIFSPQASAQDREAERIYTVIVDRFLNGDDSNDVNVTEDKSEALPFGGDFVGIENNLEYIQEMGFNTVMLSPVFEKADDDYLGYDVESYEEIAASFGGGEALENLIDAAHARGMKIIVDMPVIVVDGYEVLDTPVLSDIQQSYYDTTDVQFIDLTDIDNQAQYQEMAQTFVDEYNVDGLSMNVIQSDIDAQRFMPEGVETYAIIEGENVTVEGFDHTTDPALRNAIIEAFSTVDTEIPEYPTEDILLLADHWFTERFTIHAVEANMFPGTRISQLITYLYGYPGAIAFQYGTEVAFNGSDFPEIHPQMDLWTDKEVVDHIVALNEVFSKYPQLYNGEREVIKNAEGHYVQRYRTSDVDFILNINDSSVTKSVDVPIEAEDEGKMLSGLLIGDLLRSSDTEGDAFYAILDREETELYAIVEETGFNNGYLYAGLLIFGGFGIFIWFVAKRRKR